MCACRKAVLLDGGFSTQLVENVGEEVDGHPLWSARYLASHPKAVMQTHLDFLRAGAEVTITNTYQASIGGFKEHLGLSEEESLRLMRRAVELAKEAVDIYMKENPSCKVRPLIAGSVGPYGASLHDGSEYRGEYADTVSRQTLADWHRPRIETLVAAGVDLLALETIPAQKEAEVLVELIKDFPRVRAWISFSSKDYHQISHGELLRDVAHECWSRNSNQLVAVGVNCLNPKYVTSLFSRINEEGRPHIPLIVYPNSGEVYSPKTGWTDPDNVASVDSYVDEWLSLGVEYVGGCCRTNAEDIRRMRGHVDRWLKEGTFTGPMGIVSTNSSCITNSVGCH
ncbi:homocysteine S-methyltransferase-like isoform X2 [Thrips palmi]|uniref:Homocysteine S-methyltransferase-like isoform X2 n=1 Tax=Thrips palmi TaxID=161013 RepID=A0A6P8YAC9_THRPL|nr:homocysteine S-methyltransferase-like isoform X2 [Thrips palmi]